MRKAFKEWAVIVDLLEKGDQILILRKGGLREGHSGFELDVRDFFLFPTRYHQQTELVTDSAARQFGGFQRYFPSESRLGISSWARVEAAWKVDSLASAERLKGLHHWRDSVVEQRFDWGQARQLHVLAVRVYLLDHPHDIPLRASYGGCKSWIELEETLPREGSRPAVEEAVFASMLRAVEDALGDSTDLETVSEALMG